MAHDIISNDRQVPYVAEYIVEWQNEAELRLHTVFFGAFVKARLCMISALLVFRNENSFASTLGVSVLVFNVTCNDISVTYVTAQMCRRTEKVVPTVGLELPTPYVAVV